MTQAQEVGVYDLALDAPDSSKYQSTQLNDLAQSNDVVDLLEPTNVANQMPIHRGDVEEADVGLSIQSATDNKAIPASEEVTHQHLSSDPDADTPTSYAVQDKQESEVGIAEDNFIYETEDIVEASADKTENSAEDATMEKGTTEANAVHESEIVTTKEVPTHDTEHAHKQDVANESENPTVAEETAHELEDKSNQNQDNLVHLEEAEKVTEEEIKPLLSITLFGLSINILGKNKRENSKLKRSLISFDVNKNFKDDWKVLGISANLPVVGEVGVDLIAGKNLQSDDNIRTTMGGLLGVKVTNSKLLGNVNLDVASGQTSKSESGGIVSSKGGVLGVGINDLKNRAGLNLGLLGGGKKVTEDQKVVHGGLATIDARSRLGNAHIGLIEGQTTQSGDTKISSGGLLLADVEDSLIGDAHLGIAEVNKIETPDYQDTYFGAVNANVSNPVIGDAHLGVGEFRQIETPDYKETQFGLVNTDIKNNPVIDDIHLGIGEYYDYKAKDRHQVDKPGNQNPSDDNGSKDNGSDNGSNNGGSNKNEQSPGKGNGHPGNDNSDPIDTPGKPEPKPSNPNNSIIPGDEDLGQGKGSEHIPLDVENENEELNDKILTAFFDDDDADDPIYNFIKKLTEAGKTTTLTQDNELKTLSNLMNTTQENAGKVVQVSTVNQHASSSSSSSSGSSGPSLSSSGSGFAAYLSNGYFYEVSISNHVHGTLKKLSDQWINAPPDQPPKNSFFLSA